MLPFDETTVRSCLVRSGEKYLSRPIHAGGDVAETRFRVMSRARGRTEWAAEPLTGRTHQIRLHLSHIRYPIVGDPVYGGRRRQVAGAGPALQAALQAFRRQALHAQRLGLTHPDTREAMAFEAPVPADMASLLRVLRADTREDEA